MAEPKIKQDPTVTGKPMGPEWPEGTHPARSPSEVTHSADKITYKDNPDKPDSSSVAQTAEIPKGWTGSTE